MLYVWGKAKPLGHCFDLTMQKHTGPWLFDKHKRPYLHSLEQKKPPPCFLLDSQRMRHFLGHCFLPSPLRDLDYSHYTCIQYMYTRSLWDGKMGRASWGWHRCPGSLNDRGWWWWSDWEEVARGGSTKQLIRAKIKTMLGEKLAWWWSSSSSSSWIFISLITQILKTVFVTESIKQIYSCVLASPLNG